MAQSEYHGLQMESKSRQYTGQEDWKTIDLKGDTHEAGILPLNYSRSSANQPLIQITLSDLTAVCPVFDVHPDFPFRR
jgi:hypothetical protein